MMKKNQFMISTLYALKSEHNRHVICYMFCHFLGLSIVFTSLGVEDGFHKLNVCIIHAPYSTTIGQGVTL